MRIQAKIFGLIFIMFVMAVFLTKNTFAGTGFGISNKFTLDTTGVSPTPTTEATPTVINVTVRIKPKVINLKSKGKFTAFATFTSEYDVSDIDEGTIECEGATATKTRIFPKKNMFKSTFKIKDLKDVSPGNSVTFTVTGSLITGEDFEGNALVRVISPGKN
ncbi:MAG: hypothetical protein HZA47_07060 [Planctomycetes bacterium]|uniref:hypothetical protein n=1 Tax=Candidatus Wunengus sp. YC65 TaxID=3367701 RepID=UPI001D895B3E|nr:hypothetical protein [Planctomycetota bacterium]